MTLLLLLMLEFALGVAIGFLLSDNRRGLSSHETKFATILFLLVNAFVLLKHPELPPAVIIHLGVSWFVLIGGILSGESIRLYVIKKARQWICRRFDRQKHAICDLLSKGETEDADPEWVLKQLQAIRYSLQELESLGMTSTTELLSALERFVDITLAMRQVHPDAETLRMWHEARSELIHLVDTVFHKEATCIGKTLSVKPLRTVHRAMVRSLKVS